jgi:hypothetical protein
MSAFVTTDDLVPAGSSFPSGKNHWGTRRVTKFNPNLGRVSTACQKNDVTNSSVAFAQPSQLVFKVLVESSGHRRR